MKLHEIVRGVEVDGENGATVWKHGYVRGYNSLAEAEVVVDKEQLDIVVQSNALYQIPKKVIDDIVKGVATAIESGAIISLKGER